VAQAALQRLKHAPAPPSYRKASNSSEVHGREGNLASVQMELVILSCSSTHLQSALLLSSQATVGMGTGLDAGLSTTIKNVRQC
jgi:hypothetical protein